MPHDQVQKKIIPLFFFIVLCAFSIARFLSQLGLTPDSTGYISAAQNFIRTGHMFSWANSPSWTLLPAAEPYTEQPSGFPLFLVPFLLIFKQPIVASAVAQSFAILIFYSAMFAISQDIGVEPFFQIVCAVIVTVYRPLQYVFADVESETLFIALSLWAIHFLISSQFGRKPQLYWFAALLCAAAASLTRTIGVLMLGVFILVSWFNRKSRWISIITSFFFIVGPVIGWSLRNQILYGSLSMTHTINNHLAWEKLFPQLVFLLDSTSRNALVIILITLFTFLCIASPFIGPIYPWIRKISFKVEFSKVHTITVVLTVLGLAIAITSLAADRLGFGGDPEIGLKQIVIAIMGILLALASWLRYTNITEYPRNWKANYDWKRWETKPLYTFSLLFLAGLFHFWGITALSVVTPFSALTDRLLSPSLTFLLLSGLAGMRYLSSLVPVRFYPASIYGFGFVLVLLSPFFLKTGLAFHPGIRIPPEQELWKEIDNLPGIGKATHFYTDYNFTHEIFANRPQNIILMEDQLKEKNYLSHILEIGQCPFVLVNQGDNMSQLMDQQYKDNGLIRLVMMQGQFELFAQPCLLSP